MKENIVRMLLASFVTVLLATGSGCVTGTYGEVAATFKNQIAKGKTTKVEVLQELGDPDQRIDLGKGQETFSYIKEVYSANPFSGLQDLGKINKNTEFWITFDKNDRVVNFGERPTTKLKKYSM
ncbi:MAG: hypothetical protein QX198_03890 [Methylococcaceae bacterium]